MKTKKKFWFYALTFMGATLMFASSCDKDDDENENLPVLTTAEVTEITQTTAVSGGDITSDGGSTVTARGVCWSTNQQPTVEDNKTTDGKGIGSFISNILSLEPNTTYYVRGYANNSSGTQYGNEISFTTLDSDIIYGDGVTDVEANVYPTVIIGTQEWMAENLKTTKYRDGTSIPLVTDGGTWGGLSTPAFCWYKNDIVNKHTYGVLYNWYTVNTGNLCHTGWHVPSDAEWTTLTDYLGGEGVAGSKLKATGTIEGGNGLWYSPNTVATNETGFTAVPGGFRSNSGNFYDIGRHSFWWSSIEASSTTAWYRGVYYSHGYMRRGNQDKSYGFSVRCVRYL